MYVFNKTPVALEGSPALELQKQLQIRKARLRSIPKTSHSNKFRIIREIYTVLKYEEATIQIQTKASTTAETIANWYLIPRLTLTTPSRSILLRSRFSQTTVREWSIMLLRSKCRNRITTSRWMTKKFSCLGRERKWRRSKSTQPDRSGSHRVIRVSDKFRSRTSAKSMSRRKVTISTKAKTAYLSSTLLLLISSVLINRQLAQIQQAYRQSSSDMRLIVTKALKS